MSITRTNGVASEITVTGRELDMYTVGLANVHVEYDTVGSDFEKLVFAIETVGSIELLGTPASDEFRVAISGADVTASQLQGICNTAVATTTVAAFTF